MDKLFFKSFTIPFYRKTLGFWVLILVFGGVFMEVKQHILLAKFLFRHPLAFSILPLSFLGFSFFHLKSIQGFLYQREYKIFHQIGLFKQPDRFQIWLKIILTNLIFFLFYFLFVSFYGVQENAWVLVFLLWFSVILGIGLNLWEINRAQEKPIPEIILKRPKVNWNLPRSSWLILELRQNRPLLFLLTKILSLAFLNGFFVSFDSGIYDIRWMQFGVLAVSFLQIPILMEKAEFELVKQSWFISIPFRSIEKFSYHFLSIILVSFPELLFLIWKGVYPFKGFEFLSLPFLFLGNQLILLGIHYWKFGSSYLSNWLIASFFILFLIVIFGIPWFVICGLSLIFFFYQTRSPYHL